MRTCLEAHRAPSASSPLAVAHAISVWLPTTENWLYDQVTLLPDWIRNTVIAELAVNLDRFPLERLHSFAAAGRGVRLLDLGLRKLGLRRHLGFLERVCRRDRVQLLHSHFGNLGWANCRVAGSLGARHVVTFYGLDVNYLPKQDPRWLGRYRELFDRVDAILCEGPHMAGCIRQLGCPAEKVRLHHLGVRTEQIEFRPRRWQPGEPVRVMIAASFREKKGIPDAIETLGRVARRRPVEILLVGAANSEPRSQRELPRIEAALDRTGLRSSTRMPGYLSYAELMREAYAHHLFLSPSVTSRDGDTEGGAPVGILHMAASGMPVVATSHCDIPNLLPAGARLAAEHDIDALEAEIERLLANPESWEPELRAARLRIEEQFDAHRQAARLAAIYRELVSGPAGEAR